MDWYLIISLATLVLVIFTIVWGTGLWVRREKITITYPQMLVKLETGKSTDIKIKCTFSLLYAKGTRDCYISETWLELDRRLWKKLRKYFEEVPLRMGGIPGPNGLKKLELGKPQPLGIDLSSRARRVITDEERKELDDLIQKLRQRYKIGWKDSYGKTHWKTINQLREIQKRGIL